MATTPNLDITLTLQDQQLIRDFVAFANKFQNLVNQNQTKVNAIQSQGQAKTVAIQQQTNAKVQQVNQVAQAKQQQTLANFYARQQVQQLQAQSKALKAQNSWSAKMTSSLGSLVTSVRTFGVAYASMFVGSAIKRASEFAGNLADISDQLGISANAVYALTVAAEEAGGSFEKLQVVFGQLQTLSDSQKNSFLSRGINPDTLDTIGLFNKLLEDSALRAEVLSSKTFGLVNAIALQGKSVKDLQTLYAELGVDYDVVAKKNDELGTELAKIQRTLTAQTAVFIANNSDTILSLVKGLTALASVLATAVVPILEVAVDLLNIFLAPITLIVELIEGRGQQAFVNFSNTVLKALVDILQFLDTIGLVPDSWITGLENMIDVNNQFISSLNDVQQAQAGLQYGPPTSPTFQNVQAEAGRIQAERLQREQLELLRQQFRGDTVMLEAINNLIGKTDKQTKVVEKNTDALQKIFTDDYISSAKEFNAQAGSVITELSDFIKSFNSGFAKGGNSKTPKEVYDLFKDFNKQAAEEILSVGLTLSAQIAQKSALTAQASLLNNVNQEAFEKLGGVLGESFIKTAFAIKIAQLSGVDLTTFFKRYVNESTNRNKLIDQTEILKQFVDLNKEAYSQDFEGLQILQSVNDAYIEQLELQKSLLEFKISSLQLVGDEAELIRQIIGDIEAAIFVANPPAPDPNKKPDKNKKEEVSWQQYYQQAQQSAQLFFDFQAVAMNNQLTKTQQLIELERQRWQNQSDALKEAGLESSVYYRNQQRAFEAAEKRRLAKQESLQAKAFEQQKAANIAGTLMAGAQSFVEALPNFILAALVAALTAGQVGLIASQSNPYRRAFGGLIPGSRPNSDSVPVLATGGEYIVNRQATANNLELLDAINSGKNASPSTNVTVNISGGLVDRNFVNNELAPILNKAVKDGYLKV